MVYIYLISNLVFCQKLIDMILNSFFLFCSYFELKLNSDIAKDLIIIDHFIFIQFLFVYLNCLRCLKLRVLRCNGIDSSLMLKLFTFLVFFFRLFSFPFVVWRFGKLYAWRLVGTANRRLLRSLWRWTRITGAIWGRLFTGLAWAYTFWSFNSANWFNLLFFFLKLLFNYWLKVNCAHCYPFILLLIHIIRFIPDFLDLINISDIGRAYGFNKLLNSCF